MKIDLKFISYGKLKIVTPGLKFTVISDLTGEKEPNTACVYIEGENYIGD